MHVLVVDDDPVIAEMTCEWIRSEYRDLRISSLSSGFEAIQAMERGERFDLIISDYEMSDGSGTDVLKYMVLKRIPIFFILYTAHLYPDIPSDPGDYFLGVVDKCAYLRLATLLNQCQSLKGQ